MLTKKEVIERNYNLLERALEVVPLQILSCEEGLLEALLMSNQNLMKVVRDQETNLQKRRTMLFSPDEQKEDQKLGNEDAPYHLIEKDQMKARLKTLESFAAKFDGIISDLFE